MTGLEALVRADSIITSSGNIKIKRLQMLLKKAKERKQQGVFVLEGRKMFIEVLEQFPERIRCAYLTPEAAESFDEAHRKMLDAINVELVDEKVFAQIAETVTPQGVMAEVGMKYGNIDDMISEKNVRLLVLDNLRDPGNMGTIIRTAEAAGMSGILMSSGTVDVTNPKVVRSTMGALLRVPLIYADDLVEEIAYIRRKRPDFRLFSSALKNSIPFSKNDFGDCCGIVVGNEANGVSEEIINISDKCILIPMAGRVESLNAAVAAAILMYAGI